MESRTYTLEHVWIDRASNTVTGTVTLTDAHGIQSCTPGTLSVCSFDPTERPFQITAHARSTLPAFDATAHRLTWRFSFRIPPGRRFGGVHLDGGSYTSIHPDSGRPVRVCFDAWMDFAYALE